MTQELSNELEAHLARADGQEDVVIATYVWSTGNTRRTAILGRAVMPAPGERKVHGNASFTGGYVVRAATEARERSEGIVLLHSHPDATGWQGLSGPDHNTESEYERVARSITGLPLVGMTLGTRGSSWSGRVWETSAEPTHAESVRVSGSTLRVTWNEDRRRAPRATEYQRRTVAAWGESIQRDIARLKVLVVGVGSVGLDIAARIAATGVEHLGVMDVDVVEELNLDRMIGATREDARERRLKTEVAARVARTAATATDFELQTHDVSITTPEGLAAALDYDVIFSCVDRPWPRAVLNSVAYADLIPVIDGGIAIDTLPDGRMRGATWKTHAIVPGRPCMQCNGQLRVNELTLDRAGLLDSPKYIRQSGIQPGTGAPNVAALAASVSAGMLATFVSLVAAPAGIGVPAPLRYALAVHQLEHLPATSGMFCTYEKGTALGDKRLSLVSNSCSPTSQRTDSRRGRLRRCARRLLAAFTGRLARLAERTG
ncbi:MULTISPECIES: ThiF family adenylyltransferase [unclassified Microbacterium]|uniref:ThiF family adenylyltransferase n=1 Tax=unclassified Microbacterium TaxID=2609290 RepID=UPI001ACCAEA0|nr:MULTISPECIES: ThiF family adenylyltransferase [unclassified Microbacterium]MBN9215536.1 ThiF family adenylyltransferase [Microbacterium sp.]